MAEDKRKILVIEDEPAVLENILELLDTDLYITKGAENGLIGIRKAKEFLPDLIICDIMMPEVDGYGVLNALQEDETTSSIPFIFLTAKSELNDIRDGMNLGADDYVTKPFLPNELYNTIETRFRKIEKLREKHEEELQELRMNIASTLPHELRTPLNGILASSQILIDYYSSMDQEEVNQLHKNIFNSSKRLYDLIARYLFYSDVELLYFDDKRKDKIKDNSRRINASETIFSKFTEIAKKVDRTNDLIFDLHEASINMHLEHFLYICDELGSNAFKFSQSGRPVKVSCQQNEDYFVLSIKDEGRGMNQKQIREIGAYVQFERKVYEQQGSGLGLIIAKRLAQIYGGQLEIKSIVNEFTIATISLPVNPNQT